MLEPDYWDRPNEVRADRAQDMLESCSHWGQNGPWTDASDALANVAHWCHRAGIDPRSLFEHALYAAEGDLEDGPEAERDTEQYPEEEDEAA